MLTYFSDDEKVRGWIIRGADSQEVAVLLVDNDDSLGVAESMLKSQKEVALDLKREGLEVRHEGEITFIHLGTTEGILLFDVSDSHTVPAYTEICAYLTTVLQDPNIIKVVHDARDVSDRLFHLLRIDLRGCHDTHAWGAAMVEDTESEGGSWRGSSGSFSSRCASWSGSSGSFSSLLSPSTHKPMPHHHHSDTSVIAMDMDAVQGLADNLFALLALRKKQLEEATPSQCMLARSHSAHNLTVRRDTVAQTIQIHYTQMKRFVGKRSANINKFMEEHPGIEIVNNQCQHSFTIYADIQETMDNALADIRPYQMPSSTSGLSLKEPAAVRGNESICNIDYCEPILFAPFHSMVNPESPSSYHQPNNNDRN